MQGLTELFVPNNKSGGLVSSEPDWRTPSTPQSYLLRAPLSARNVHLHLIPTITVKSLSTGVMEHGKTISRFITSAAPRRRQDFSSRFTAATRYYYSYAFVVFSAPEQRKLREMIERRVRLFLYVSLLTLIIQSAELFRVVHDVLCPVEVWFLACIIQPAGERATVFETHVLPFLLSPFFFSNVSLLP